MKRTFENRNFPLLPAMLAVCLGAMFSGAATAEDSAFFEENTLTGDWSGKRSALSERGVDIEFSHRSDLISNLSGGAKKETLWLGFTDAVGSFDLEKLHGWSGLSVFFQLHSQLGGKPNNNIDSFMGVDNQEVGTNTAQFYQAWVQQNLYDDSLSLLVGLYPVDAEFYVTDTSGEFTHPSMGMSAELAQAGVNGPPVYPMGALGTRVKYISPGRTSYFQMAVTDGVPGDPANAHGTHIRLDKGDGTFAIAEIGYAPEQQEGFNKASFGMWRYSTRFDDLVDVDGSGNPIQRSSTGWYFLAERTLFSEQDPAQGMAGFFRYGTASKDIHDSDGSFSLGLRYAGLFDGRDEDVAGIAMTSSKVSAKYKSLNPTAASETMLEITYRMQFNNWLTVQPLYQRIMNPGLDSAAKDVDLIGLRMEVVL